LEVSSLDALNQLIVRDKTTPYFVANLVKSVADADNDHVSARHAAGALYVLNQKVYKPEKATQVFHTMPKRMFFAKWIRPNNHTRFVHLNC
jgi:hypothetical protein